MNKYTDRENKYKDILWEIRNFIRFSGFCRTTSFSLSMEFHVFYFFLKVNLTKKFSNSNMTNPNNCLSVLKTIERLGFYSGVSFI